MCSYRIATFGCHRFHVQDLDKVVCAARVELDRIAASNQPRRKGDSQLIRLQMQCDDDEEQGDIEVYSGDKCPTCALNEQVEYMGLGN